MGFIKDMEVIANNIDTFKNYLNGITVDLPNIELGHISLWHHALDQYEKMTNTLQRTVFVICVLKMDDFPSDIKRGLIWYYQFDEKRTVTIDRDMVKYHVKKINKILDGIR